MSETDTSKCMWQKESNMGVCLLKCEEVDCDFKILNEQLQRYKQIIKEIKEIAYKNLQTNLCSNCDGVGLDLDCEDTNCSYYQIEKILQKCEEVNEKK